jgi:small ligand-binding sensory domain FIST
VDVGVAGLIDVAQGLSPVGRVHRVSAARGRVIETLDERPAFEVFAEHARPLLDDLPRAAQTIFVAEDVDPDEAHVVFYGLLGFDPERGLLATSEPIMPGAGIRFAWREPSRAREHLRAMTLRVRDELGGRPPSCGFYFNGAGRGRGLFGVPDHDTAFIQGTLGRFPMIGFFDGGELAASRYHLHAGALAVVP